jgi:hypothetical protein
MQDTSTGEVVPVMAAARKFLLSIFSFLIFFQTCTILQKRLFAIPNGRLEKNPQN